MNSAEKIKGGFETSSGTDYFVTSPASYSDNKWHYAVVTYGGSTVILYIDGVQVASKSTSGASPDSSGAKPVRVAANSRVTPPTTNFFIGGIDEVRVWNDDLTAAQQASAFAGSSFNTAEQVLHLDFTNVQSGLTGGYTYGPSLTLSGESAEAQNGDNAEKSQGPPDVPGKGLGLNCEHFTQQGPLRCR